MEMRFGENAHRSWSLTFIVPTLFNLKAQLTTFPSPHKVTETTRLPTAFIYRHVYSAHR